MSAGRGMHVNDESLNCTSETSMTLCGNYLQFKKTLLRGS